MGAVFPWGKNIYLPKLPVRLHKRGAADDVSDIAFFVHGIYSSASTWAELLSLITADNELQSLAYDVYEYPSRFFGIPFLQKMLNIPELASGLRTQINAHFGSKRRVRLVGHSLGGVIARRFLVEELRSNRSIERFSLMALASPHGGSDLARIGRRMSLLRNQVAQLVPASEELLSLTRDWKEFNVEELIEVQYVAGGADAVVDLKSSLPLLHHDKCHVIAGCDHSSIARPTNADDLNYVLIKKFLLNQLGHQTPSKPRSFAKMADPLFEFYGPEHEKYYYCRKDREAFVGYMSPDSPVWLHGPSGTGKTSVLRRTAQLAGWDLKYITLSGLTSPSAEELYRSFLINAIDLEERGDYRSIDRRPINELVKMYKADVSSSSNERQRFVLIEEIPISDPKIFESFIEFVSDLTQQLQSNVRTRNRVLIALSSIPNPLENLKGGSLRLRDRMQFVPFELWSKQELEGLLALIESASGSQFTASETVELVDAAEGLPRFIKLLLRDHRNRPRDEPMRSRISRIRAENIVS